MRFVSKLISRLRYAFAGIFYAVVHDSSFRTQVIIGLPLVLLVAYLGAPLREVEVAMLIGAYWLVLITELQNTSFEAALDRLHPELHDEIGRSKDMAAGAVLLAALLLLIVSIHIIWW